MTATRGRRASELVPFLTCSSSLLMTQEAEPSEPAAGMVSATATGRQAPTFAFPQKKSHTSPW